MEFISNADLLGNPQPNEIFIKIYMPWKMKENDMKLITKSDFDKILFVIR